MKIVKRYKFLVINKEVLGIYSMIYLINTADCYI